MTSSKYWSELVAGLKPYVPGEQPKQQKLIKLNTNENPYPPAPGVFERINEEQLSLLRLYPDPSNSSLKQALANHFGVDDSNICVGNGSDEILAFAFQALFKQSKPVLFPDITYGFYTVYCGLYDIDYRELPLTDDFSIDLSGYRQTNGGIIFPNPNAPTGIGKPLADIEQLLRENTESVVIVDEAYVDFGAESAVPLVQKYPNLLVVQTLSKSRSLAGIRVGYAIGDAGLIEGLERIKNCFNPYSIDRLAEVAATEAIIDTTYFEDCRDKIIRTRDWTVAQLSQLGFDVLPSATNFIMARPDRMEAQELFLALREKGVLVRYFRKARIGEYLRISIGTDQEMAAMVEAVATIYDALP